MMLKSSDSPNFYDLHCVQNLHPLGSQRVLKSLVADNSSVIGEVVTVKGYFCPNSGSVYCRIEFDDFHTFGCFTLRTVCVLPSELEVIPDAF